MADINVERKGPSVWPWILGLLAAALLLWVLVEMLGDRDPEVVRDAPVGWLETDAGPADPIRHRAV